MQGVNPSPDAIYGMVSRSIQHLFPSNLNPIFVPNCVELDHFTHKEHSGSTNVIGWCGAPRVWFKQFHWAKEIAKQFGTELQVSCKVPFEDPADWVALPFDDLKKWYSTIDILLITSIPNGQSETGPLPAFEAIASGVLVIGTPVGNFNEVPGPKFSTVEEAGQILSELKSDPERVKQIAKEQYDCIVQKWNYKVVAEKWREMFRSALKNAEST
jgi:glycosyltransferase involved in cell wall biosynthesis